MSKNLFKKAHEYASSLGHRYCLTEHLLFVIINSIEFKRFCVMSLPNLNYEKASAQVISDLMAYFKIYEESINQNEVYTDCKNSEIIEAIIQSVASKSNDVSELFLAIYNRSLTFSAWVIANSDFDKLFTQPKEPTEDTTEQNPKTDFDSIRQYVELIQPDSSITNRDSEIAQLVMFLSKQNKTNILLLGAAGVGKSAILEYLVYLIETKDSSIPEHLQNCKIISVNVGNLVAGSKLRGEFEAKVKAIFEFVKANPEYIVFIDEAHMIKGAGTSSTNQSNDLANMIKPVISRSGIKLIAATTWDEYYQSIDRDPALKRRFHIVHVNEPNNAETVSIVTKVAAKLSEFHDVKYPDTVIQYAVELNSQYVTDRKNPDKTIDFLDLLGSSAKLSGIETVTKEFCTSVFCEFNQIDPANIITESHLDLDLINQSVRNKVIGQDSAISKAIDLIGLKLSGIDSQLASKPLTLLFTGASGVGKTETCVQLATQLKMPIVKMDMSEYSEPYSVSSLIGTSPGYIGFNQGNGKLIDLISKHTQAIFVLDEIEKTHPEVLNVFLSLFDTGIISSLSGKQVCAKNHIFIMTSNLGAAEAIKEAKGSSFGFVKQTSLSAEDVSHKEVAKWFKPELLNRIEKVIFFDKLSDETYQIIIESQVKKFVSQVNSKCQVHYDSSIIEFIQSKLTETDHALGARPVSRIINEHLKIPVSKFVLKGINHVSVEVKNNKLEWMEYGDV